MTASNTTPEAIPGRWAISGTGLGDAILLDTATGETWHAGADGIWVRMLKAEESPTGSFSLVSHVRTWESHTTDPYVSEVPRRATP